jgi:hypothetical protein
MDWGVVEQQAGVYNWTFYDALIDDLEVMNVTSLFCVHPKNELYPKEPLPTQPAAVAAFAKFFAALTARYGSRPGYWAAELSNEPNLKQMNNTAGAWSSFGVAAAQAARANSINADAVITGPALAGASKAGAWPIINWFEAAVNTSHVLDLLNLVTVHTYRPTQPETVGATFQSVQHIIDANTSPRSLGPPPVASGEWGYTSCTLSACWRGVTPTVKSLYVVREWLVGHALGRPVAVWYDWHEDCTDPTNRECRFGLVTNSGYSPLPAYHTASVALSTLRGMWAAQVELQPLAAAPALGDDDAGESPAMWAVTYTLSPGADAAMPSNASRDVLDTLGRASWGRYGQRVLAGSQPATVDAAAVWAGVNSNSTAESGLRGNVTLKLDAGREYHVLNATGSIVQSVVGPTAVIEAGGSPMYLQGQ